MLKIRFGQAPGDLATRMETISNPAELRQLLRQAAMADSLPLFEQELAAVLSKMNWYVDGRHNMSLNPQRVALPAGIA